MSQKPWNETLDDLLVSLNNGEFVDQTIHEFESVVEDTVLYARDRSRNVQQQRRSAYKDNVKPFVKPSAEYSTYTSRREQILNCLSNLDYSGYPETKTSGYRTCIARFIELTKNNGNDLRPVEEQLNNDLKMIRAKKRTNSYDDYLNGYYDALCLIKKIIYNSKLARLQELSNKIR